MTTATDEMFEILCGDCMRAEPFPAEIKAIGQATGWAHRIREMANRRGLIIEIAVRGAPTPKPPRTHAVIQAELDGVNERIANAKGWGAALTALAEWRRDLERELAALARWEAHAT